MSVTPEVRFEKWFARVSQEFQGICGLSPLDLPDKDYWTMFEHGMSPRKAAVEVLQDEGYFDYMYAFNSASMF